MSWVIHVGQTNIAYLFNNSNQRKILSTHFVYLASCKNIHACSKLDIHSMIEIACSAMKSLDHSISWPSIRLQINVALHVKFSGSYINVASRTEKLLHSVFEPFAKTIIKKNFSKLWTEIFAKTAVCRCLIKTHNFVKSDFPRDVKSLSINTTYTFFDCFSV